MADNQTQTINSPDPSSSTPPNVDPMSDPFYLHGSEQPGTQLVAEKLTPTNYIDWSKAFHNALGAKNKLGFVDGSIPDPGPGHATSWAWTRNNIMVLSWIQQAVDPGIRKTIMSSKTALEAWRSLRDRYGQGDMVRIAELIESICTLKQGNLSVTEYYGNLIALRDELDNYQPLEPCACSTTSHNTCRAMLLVLGYRDTNYVIQFLRGLNDNFSTVRSQVLFGDALPPIDRVFQRMLQHERQLSGSSSGKTLTTEGMAFAAHGNPNYLGKNPRPYCTFCKFTGHTEDTCYHKHGWPPGMTNPKTSTSTNKPLECSYFKKQGHTKDKCFQKHGYPSRPNSKSRVSANATTTSADNDEVKLTKAEYEKFLSLMKDKDFNKKNLTSSSSFSAATWVNQSPPTPGKYSFTVPPGRTSRHAWILDTGASDHIVCSLAYLVHPKPISNIPITLPTGDQVHATHIGTVTCVANLVLENVLFVPQFNFNLISVSKLTTNPSLHLTFFSTVCLIQDLQLRRMIGSAKLTNGLYLFYRTIIDQPPSPFAATSAQSFDLWHYRLGHV
ncbi:unnamed protein product [Linum trigynum]|uniref:Retrotransposon Copia-like N-terminal domain-containing protein n=1 Tax=Linum trigynum TaxID=586398 RepID=A0AAV2D1W2_9ROSI